MPAGNSPSGEPPFFLSGLSAAVVALAYSSDGQRLFGAAYDGKVIAWPGLGGSLPETWLVTASPPRSLRVSRHGSAILVATAAHAFVATLEPRGPRPWITARELGPGEAQTPREILAAEFFGDGSVLLATTEDGASGELAVHESTGALPQVASASCGRPVAAVATARSGRRALLSFRDGSFAVAYLDHDFRLDLPSTATGGCAALSPDASEVAVARGPQVELYGFKDLAPTASFQTYGPVERVLYGTPRHLLLTIPDAVAVHPVGWDGPIWILPHGSAIAEAVMRRDGELVVIRGAQGDVSAWHATLASHPVRLHQPARRATAIAIEPRGHSFAVGYDDGTVCVIPLVAAWHTHLPEPEVRSSLPALFSAKLFWCNTGEAATPWFVHFEAEWWVIRRNDFPEQSLYTALSSAGSSIDFESWPRNWWKPD